MPVQTGRRGVTESRKPGAVLAGMLHRDLAYRQLLDAGETLLGCGTLEHVPGRMGRINYYFAESASVVLLLRGGGWYREDASVAHRLAPGDAFVRLPGRLHATIPDDDGQWIEFFLHMPKSAWDAAVFAGVMRGVGVIWHPGLHEDILMRLREVRERMRDPSRWSTAAVIGTMLQVVAELRERHDRQANGGQGHPMAQAELILCNNLDQVVSVRAVASQLGLEWETFRKQFRARTGQSPAAYRNLARLQHARRLLIDQHLSVTEVALLVGYADPFAFSKAFRRWSGVAPSAVR